MWAWELVLAVQQALSFQGEHCDREGTQLLQGRAHSNHSKLPLTLDLGAGHCSKAELEEEQQIRPSAGISASPRNRKKPPSSSTEGLGQGENHLPQREGAGGSLASSSCPCCAPG